MRVFQRVVDAGGFALAARALDMSPTTVTRLVGDLEQHLGARLLQRTTRRMALTEAGENYLERLRLALQELDDAEAAVAAGVKDLSGLLRIVATSTLATHLLAPAVPLWRQQHPRASLEIAVDDAPLNRVEEFDVSLLIGDAGFNADIVARPLWDGDRILCASPGYLREAGVPVEAQDLARHVFLRNPFRQPGVHGARRLRLVPAVHAAPTAPVDVAIQVGLQSPSVEVLQRAALEGAGIALLPRVLVAAALRDGQLVHVLPGWAGPRYTLYAAIAHRRLVPARTRVFLDFIQKLEKPPARGVAARPAPPAPLAPRQRGR
jgi:DNA-binding transcriptional LysR family regulator